MAANSLNGAEPTNSTAMLPNATGVPQNQMKKFLTLKNKIIRTDEIIQRYKSRVCECEETSRQLRETQAQLVAMESGVKGLKVELNLLHQDKNRVDESLRVSQDELSYLRAGREENELLIQQLKAQVGDLTVKLEKLESGKPAAGQSYSKLNEEKEKWKNMYQKARRDLSNLKERRRSGSQKSSSPLLSPSCNSIFEELATPPSANEETMETGCTVEGTNGNSPRCLSGGKQRQVRGSSTNQNDPLVIREDMALSDKQKQSLGRSHEQCSVNLDINEVRIERQLLPEGTARTSECSGVTPPTKRASPLQQSAPPTQGGVHPEPSLSESEESDVEETTPTVAPSSKSTLLPEKLVESALPTRNPSHSAPPISLSTALFGDSDSDDMLSVSEDSSDDELDDLAEMLNSEPIIGQKAQLSKTLSVNSSVSVSCSLSVTSLPTLKSRHPSQSEENGDSGSDQKHSQLATSPEDAPVVLGEARSLCVPESKAAVLMSPSLSGVERATGHVSSMTEGSKFIVPCVEVESVEADTLSSEDSDSELEISFSDACISVNVLSPLPLTPVTMDTNNRSLDTPLSPLPISPSNDLPLSPLPQSPTDEHSGDVTLSPLPPSPTDDVLQSCVLSPLPCSPVTSDRSKVITPLPASPVSMQPTGFAESAPLTFADTAPQGLQVPTPCNVVVMVSSQSDGGGSTTPTRNSLSLSDGSPFSPPTLTVEMNRSSEAASSHSLDKPCSKETKMVDFSELLDVFSEEAASLCPVDTPAGRGRVRETVLSAADAPTETRSEERSPFIGPVLPPNHPLNRTLNPPAVSNPPLKRPTVSNPSSNPPAISNPPTVSKLTTGKKRRQGKKRSAQKPVATNRTVTSPTFDSLLQSFQLVPQTRSNHQQTKKCSSQTKIDSEVVPNMSTSSPAHNDSSECLPPVKRAKLDSTGSELSLPLLCSPLPLATPVQALPGYQAQTTPPDDEALSPGYRLRSRQVNFFETVKRRRKSSSCSSDNTCSPSKEPPTLRDLLIENSENRDQEEPTSETATDIKDPVVTGPATRMVTEEPSAMKKPVAMETEEPVAEIQLPGTETVAEVAAVEAFAAVEEPLSEQPVTEAASGMEQPSAEIEEPAMEALTEFETPVPEEVKMKEAPLTSPLSRGGSDDKNTADLSEGELESDEEELASSKTDAPKTTNLSSQVEPRGAEPMSMVIKKRRQTDGATGQEEDQTPASSPLQLLSFSPTALAPPDLSKVNCGYGPSRQPERKPQSDIATTSKQMVDDIFNTTIPLVGASQPTKPQATPLAMPTPPAMPPQHSTLSLAQQQLPVWLQCPLPLPDWLVTALTSMKGVGSRKSHANVTGQSKKKKSRSVVKEPITRQKSQKPTDYILANLERLVLGQIHMAPIITMFSDLKNITSSSVLVSTTITFLLRHYLPSIDAVVQLYHDQCDSVRTSPHDRQPLDSAFPPALLKPECQLLALFAHLPRMNVKMTTFLSEMNNALYQTIVTPGVRFHQLAAAIRLFTGVCRLQGDPERVLFMCFDLTKKPLLVNELPVIAGVASVWPLPLARKPGFKVQPGGLVDVKELEKQVLPYSLEVVVMTMIKEKAPDLNVSLSPHMHTLCGWVQVTGSNLDKLTNRLLHILNTSPAVNIDYPPPPPSPWRRPRPSVLAFHIVHCLRLISHFQGWVWTNDTLIRAHLWPLLQKWNSSEGSGVKDAAAVCTVRLIGFVSLQGLTADPLSSSITQLQRVLTALISKTKSTQDKFSALQLAAVDSLLELCPPTHPRAAEVVGVVRVWLNGLCKPAVTCLAREFNERLSAYRSPA